MAEAVATDPAEPYIAAALAHAGGTHSVEDIFRMDATGEVQIWRLPRGVVVTEIQQTPQLRYLHIFLAAADTLEEIRAVAPAIYAFGRQHGCARVTLAGREGWQRTFATREDGWTPLHLVMTKEL